MLNLKSKVAVAKYKFLFMLHNLLSLNINQMKDLQLQTVASKKAAETNCENLKGVVGIS